MLGDDFNQALLQLKHVVDLTLDIAGLTLSTAMNLVDHDIGVRQGESLALGSGTQQNGSHARGHAEAISGHVTCQKLHGVVNGEPGTYRAAGRVDINVDVLFAVLHLQEEQLGNNQIRNVIVDRRSDENDSILEQAGINVVAAFAASGLLNHHWDEDGLRTTFDRLSHDFCSETAGSNVACTLTFALRKSRVLPSRTCSASAFRPSCSSSSRRILSTERLYRTASCRIR